MPVEPAVPGTVVDPQPVPAPYSGRRLVRIGETVLIGVVYFVAAKAGLRLAFLHPSATPVWPPTGIAIAALLLSGVSAWPGIFLGAFAANATTAGTAWTSLGIAAGNTLEAVAAALLVTRYAGGSRAFERLETITRFAVAAALLSPMISATVGVTSLALGGAARWASYDPVWLTWWLGDVSGAMVVAPLLLLWSAAPSPGWNAAEAGERLLYGAALFAVSFTVFYSRFPFGFAIVPFLIWAAFRFGARDALTAVAIVSGIAIMGTVHRLGPFAVSTAQTNTSLLYLSVFMALMAIIVLTISRVVADRAATADELRRRVSTEQEARRAAERAERQATQLAMVTTALAEALTPGDVARVIVDHAVGALGARAGGLALLADDAGGALELIHVTGVPPETARRWQRFRPEEHGLVAECLRTGRAVALESEADLDARFTQHRDLPEELRHGARIGVPLVAAGRSPAGVLILMFAGPRRLDGAELGFVQTLGQQCTQAIERARLYEREHRAAETFQRALLPGAIPQVPGVTIHTVYQPGASESNVGGDWYDVFRVPSGKLVLSIGDVAGRGLNAAVVMGEIRQTIRTAALDHDDPAAVLERASEALTLAHGRGAMATAIVGVLDPVTSELSYATAGHPAPVLAVPGGAPAATLPAGGGPLGYLSDVRTPSWKVALPAGALLVLYTDGLIEQTRDVVAGQASVIAAACRELEAPSTDAAEAILAAVLPDRRGHDDIAIIAVAMDPAPFEQFDLTLPAEPPSAGVIRQAVRRLARVAGMEEAREIDFTVAVGEAVNNAIEHAYRAAEGTVTVRGLRDAAAVRVSIIDTGTWRAARAPDGGGRGLALIRELADFVDLQQTADGTSVAIGMRLHGRPALGAAEDAAALPSGRTADDGRVARRGGPSAAAAGHRATPAAPVVIGDRLTREDRGTSGARLRPGSGQPAPIVEASGDLDAATLGAVREALADAARKDAATVIVSFERVRYMDSLTIRQLFEFGRNLATQRRVLAFIVAPDAPLARIMAIAGLASEFRTFGSEAEARAAFEEGHPHG